MIATQPNWDEESPLCPRCGYSANSCWSCPSCGHCDMQHGFDGVYCSWESPNGIICPCLRERSYVLEHGTETWA